MTNTAFNAETWYGKGSKEELEQEAQLANEKFQNVMADLKRVDPALWAEFSTEEFINNPNWYYMYRMHSPERYECAVELLKFGKFSVWLTERNLTKIKIQTRTLRRISKYECIIDEVNQDDKYLPGLLYIILKVCPYGQEVVDGQIQENKDNLQIFMRERGLE